MRVSFFIALLASVPILVGACSAPERGAVYLNGDIDAGKVKAALDLLGTTRRELVITSAGGDPVAAMRLGRTLHERRIGLTVRGYCLSACATYVLTAAEPARIEEGALVAFHHTDTALLAVLGPRLGNAAPLQERATAELAFMREIGVAPSLLVAPLQAMQPICFDVFANGRGESMNGGVRTRAELYAPSRAQLGSFGVVVTGRNIESEAELSAWRRRYGRQDRSFAIVLEPGSTPYDLDGIQRALTLTPRCAGTAR